MKCFFAASVLISGLALALPALADDVGQQIDAARLAYGRGDSLRAMENLQSAAAAMGQRLSEQLARLLPPPPAGWDAGPAEFQALDGIGGGLSMARGYTRDLATLNAQIVIDNPGIGSSVAMFDAASSSPGWSRVKVGAETALVRYDGQARSGEILMAVDGRALLQIEGNEIDRTEVLLETARGWNIGAVRKLLGG